MLRQNKIHRNNLKQMTQDKSQPQDQEAAAINHDPSLNKEAINELVDQYEQSANSNETQELISPTQKQLGDVERSLEDSVMGIEDAS